MPAGEASAQSRQMLRRNASNSFEADRGEVVCKSLVKSHACTASGGVYALSLERQKSLPALSRLTDGQDRDLLCDQQMPRMACRTGNGSV